MEFIRGNKQLSGIVAALVALAASTGYVAAPMACDDRQDDGRLAALEQRLATVETRLVYVGDGVNLLLGAAGLARGVTR